MKNKSVLENTIKHRLKAGEVIHCAWHQFGDPETAEVLVHCGWDVVIVDGEHGPMAYQDIMASVRAVEAAGGQVICRIPSYDPMVLNKYLDAGVRSLMIPNVRTTEQAEAIAQACLYPPHGRRGYAAPCVRASGFGAQADYLAQSRDNLLLILQIEHVEAIDHIETMAKIPGVDMLFIGLNDMGGSIGKLEQLHTPEVVALFDKSTEKMKQSGIMMGSIPGPTISEKDLMSKGYQLIAGPTNVLLLRDAARAARARIKDLL